MISNPYAAPTDPNADVDPPIQSVHRHIKVRFYHIIYLVGILFLFSEAANRSHGNDNSPLLFACCFLILILHTYLLVASTSGLRWGIISVSVAIGLSGLFFRIPNFLYILTGLHLLVAGAIIYRALQYQRYCAGLLNSDNPVEGLTAEIAKHGETVELLNLLAIAHGKNRDFGTAIPHLRRSLELQPNNSVILANLAWYLSEAREFAESEVIFQRAMARPQNKNLNLLVRANYSCMLAESGRVQESTELLAAVEQECADMKKMHPPIRNALGKTFQRVHAKLDESISPADG